jgi:hypothetical protein
MSVAGVTLNSGTPALSVVTMPNGRQALRVACNTGENTEIKFPSLAGNLFGGEMYMQAEGCTYINGVNQFLFYISPDATRGTNVASAGFGGYTTPLNNPAEPTQGVMTHRLGKSDLAITGTITYPFQTNWVSVRIIPRSGYAPVVYIYGIGFAPQPPVSRVFVTVDDGYDSWFQLGQPVFDARNIPVTLAVIPAMIHDGITGAYMRQLQGLVNRGGAIVAHGPNVAGGAGNMLTAFADNAARVADMSAVRDWIAANGLATPNYDKCYVFPQGTWQASASDSSLLDAMLAAGFTTGRSAAPQPNVYWCADALSKYQHLTMPIIGHTWSGSTANETTNISNIVSYVNNAATNGSDIFLMFHRVVPTSTLDGQMSSIGIRLADITSIADAIAAKMSAGAMRPGVLPELAASRAGNFWGQ